MSGRCLFVLSADFGEFVTASLFCRGQPFASRFALPARIASYAGTGQADSYSSLEDLRSIVARARPDVVVLCSGYLFAVNGLIAPDALAGWIDELRRQGIALATTDPWLRIWAMRPGARFEIHSISRGGVDAVQTERMLRLQAGLERMFEDVPHVFAVPLQAARDAWMPFYNPAVARAGHRREATAAPGSVEDWLFVLSREDYAFLAGYEGERFFGSVAGRLDELAADEGRRLTVIAPPQLGPLLAARMARYERLAFLPFCDFVTFESLLRRSAIVVYWNMLSASLLYCLYYGIPPVFLGRGHQARVCHGLFEHVAEQVYRGEPPPLLDLEVPLGGAVALTERLGVRPWLDRLKRHYAQALAPAEVIERIRGHYGG